MEPATPEEILEGLNPEQREVVMHAEGALLVGAVAGAGKTAALVRRVAYLIATDVADPGEILAVTFSARAAAEMNERLEALGVDTQRCRIGTWHSLAFQLARAEGDISGWTVDTSSRYRTILKEVTGYKGMKWDAVDVTVLSQFVTRCKAVAAAPLGKRAREIADGIYLRRPRASSNPAQLVEAFRRAESERKDRQLMTFDDMLVDAFTHLQNDEIRERWSRCWRFVMQDESQDENEVQSGIGSALARSHGNYMVVGDSAQAIYGFRGASPVGLLSFEERWGAKKVLMHRNYRSAPVVLAAANKILSCMDAATHLGMTMTAERELAGEVSASAHGDAEEEASAIATRALLEHEEGRAWKDVAVLYRINAQSRAVEEAMLRERIPYVVVGGTNFYQRREVRSLLCYLRLALGRGKFGDVKRSINSPFRFLGRRFTDRVQEAGDGEASWTEIVRDVAENASGIWAKQRAAATAWAGLVDEIAKAIEVAAEIDASDPSYDCLRDEAKPAKLIQQVVSETGYVAWLRRDEGTESSENDRITNVRELIRSAERFPTVAELIDYIDDQIARSEKAAREGVKGDQVTLMSVHKSKGLEWPVVHLVGAIEGVIPHAKAEDLGEERRLFYVAVTRAKVSFRVSWPSKAAFGGKVTNTKPSRFVAEAGIGKEVAASAAE